ncbi:MAG: dppB [Chlamydiia bacterium]|nr:dppB [Chlamydiia bacterium]
MRYRYILKRLLLLPITLFLIILVNFVIINLAPGEPVFVTEVGKGGEASRKEGQGASRHDERYLQFREFFGLTLPILWNSWPWTTSDKVLEDLTMLQSRRNAATGDELSASAYSALQIETGDRARFVLPILLQIMEEKAQNIEIRKEALYQFLRGATRFAHIGARLSEQERQENEQISVNNLYLDDFRIHPLRTKEELNREVSELQKWYGIHQEELQGNPTREQKIVLFFFETRFSKYLGRVFRLDFGVLRSDTNRSVISEVISRLKYSLTLSLLPMLATFFLCQIFGLCMAIWKDSTFDRSLNLFFLLLYATPVFVIGPFLIETIALHHNYPFTSIPFPIRGFSSSEAIYSNLTTIERIFDIARHITLPLLTILYGSLAVQSRLSRAIFIDTLNYDFVRTARAKGVGPLVLYLIHVGKNAAIPIVTSVAGSLGAILGGSVIVETIFEIHGFGKFFYDAILNRDYNVMMFSSLVGSFLGLVGYLVADITYMWLDPRVDLEAKRA